VWHCASFNTFALGCDPAKGKRTGPGQGSSRPPLTICISWVPIAGYLPIERAHSQSSQVTRVSLRPHALHNANRLKLGLFSLNADGGIAITRVPERWQAGWAEIAEVAKMVDCAGRIHPADCALEGIWR
jgi:hypothetical protein